MSFDSVRAGFLITKRLPEMFYTLCYSVSSLAALFKVNTCKNSLFRKGSGVWHPTAFNLPSQPGSQRVPEVFNILWLRKVY